MPLKNSPENGKRPLLWQQVLIVAITLTVVAVAILLGSQTYRQTREMATEQFNLQQLMLARSAAIGIESCLEEVGEELPVLAEMPAVQTMTPECLTYMRLVYGEESRKASIRRLDRDGILRFIYPDEGWRREMVGQDYSEEALFIEARETGERAMSEQITNETGEIRFRVAYPVFIEKKEGAREFNGVIVASFDIEELGRQYISPIVSGKTGYAWLLNEEGIFLAHHEEEFVGRDGFEVRAERNPEISYEAIEQIQRRMMAGEEGVGHYVSGWHQGQRGEIKKLIAYTPVHVDDHILSVAVCAPVSEVENVIREIQRSELYTLGFVVLVLIAGGFSLLVTLYRWSHYLEQEVARRTGELRETSDYLSNLIRYAHAPIIVWNPDKQVTIFNEAFEKMSGQTKAEMMEQSLDVLFPEESRPDSLQKIESASEGENWETVEIPILRQDGERRIGLWNSANIYAEDGKTLLATIVQGQDITKRRRAEEEQRQLNARLAQRTHQLTALHKIGRILAATLDLREIYRMIFREIAQGLLGSPHLTVALLDEDAKTIYCGFAIVDGEEIDSTRLPPIPLGEGPVSETIRTREPRIVDLQETRSYLEKRGRYVQVGDERQPKSALYVPLISGDKVMGAMHLQHYEADAFRKTDMPLLSTLASQAAVAITNARLYAQEQERTAALARALEQQRELDRLKDQFVQNVSHELRTPLGIAHGYAELLDSGELGKLQPEHKQAVSVIARRVRMLRNLVEQFTTISELETKRSELEPVHLADLVHTLLDNSRVSVEQAGLTLEAEIAPDLPPVHGHVPHLRQVLDNLIENATKFTPSGGVIAVRLWQDEMDIVLEVTDTGIGIPHNQLERIFERFYQVDGSASRRYGGTGLGLALVKEIVEAHDGQVAVQSTVGEGSVFQVRLPLE